MTINGGTVTAIAKEARNGFSLGLFAHYDITVNGGAVTATAGSAYKRSCGLFSDEGSITVNELSADVPTRVIAAGETAAMRSYDGYGTEVKNHVEGIGWSDFEGTADETKIDVNTEGTTYSYKKVDFGHVYKDVVVEPTCTDGGYTRHECERCGKFTTSDEKDALGHDFTSEVADEKYLVSAADCTNSAVYYKSCSRCGEASDKLTFSYGSPLGHDMGEWETVDEPTCLDAGTKIKRCSRCPYTEDGTIDPLGHDYESEVVDATCVEDGYTRNTCTRCGDTYDDDLEPALGHEYEPEVTEPTCEEEGFTTFVCKRCGDKYIDEGTMVAALGHEWDGGKPTKTPTTDAEGEVTYTCKVCGNTKKSVIPKLTPAPIKPTPTPTPTPTPAQPSKQTGDDIATLAFIALLALVSGAAVMFAKKKKFDK